MLTFFMLTFICLSPFARVLAAANGVQSAYTAPGSFPTSVYKSYWNDPTATSAQPQPVISDPATVSAHVCGVDIHAILLRPEHCLPRKPDRSCKLSKSTLSLVLYFVELRLTHFLQNDTVDPHLLPSPLEPSQLLQEALAQIKSIISNPVLSNNTCAQCLASLAVAKMLVLAVPEQGPLLAQALCVHFNYSTSCYDIYSNLAVGSVLTQVVALGDTGGYDGQVNKKLWISLRYLG